VREHRDGECRGSIPPRLILTVVRGTETQMKATTREREQGPASRWLAMAIVGLALACAGCSGLMPKLETPQLSLVGIKIQDMTFFEQRLLVRLRVRNPNDLALGQGHHRGLRAGRRGVC